MSGPGDYQPPNLNPYYDNQPNQQQIPQDMDNNNMNQQQQYSNAPLNPYYQPQPNQQQPVYMQQQTQPHQQQQMYIQQPQQPYQPQQQQQYYNPQQTQSMPQQQIYGNPQQSQQQYYNQQQSSSMPQQQIYTQPIQQNNDIDSQMNKQSIDNGNDNDNTYIPNDGNYGETEYGKRLDYTAPVYQDKIVLFIWIAHLIFMCVLIVLTRTGSGTEIKSSGNGFGILFLCSIIGGGVGYLWIFILRQCSGTIIKFMLWANLIFLILTTAVNFMLGLIFTGVISAIFTILFALYMWSVWNKIPFTEALIEIASDIIKMYKSVILLTFICLAMQFIWIIIFSMISTAYLYRNNSNGFVVFLLCISFYWNLETFKNVCHTSVCGVGATWFFTDYNNITEANNKTVVRSSFKRSMTTSLGSIAFGSLIVAFIQAIRAMLRPARNEYNSIIICIIDCLLGCIEHWLEFLNNYAFAHIAIYGDNFINSAKNAFNLLQTKGIMAYVNDNLVGFGILCGSFVAGFISAVIAMGIATTSTALQTYSTAYAFIGFLIGFFMCNTVLSVLASMVLSIFVCYAEDPNAMEKLHGNEYFKLTSAMNNVPKKQEQDENYNV